MSKNTNTLAAGRPSARSNKTATLASLSDETEMKRVNFQVSAEQHRKLKVYAAKRGRTIRELMTEYVTALPDE
jgi:hypothetical protein